MSLPRKKMTVDFPGCPVEAALGFLDGKWKGVILFHLMGGTRRFNEMRRLMPNITPRMLTKQLRELEDSGLISRTVYPVVPPHVDYDLTELGKTLEPVVRALHSWGLRHVACKDNRIETSVEPLEGHNF
ncbi:UNVERIFIED_ORG: HxlR family transcriptional regulator [Martelella mediterranea]